jgi:hypothetical protein
MYLNPDRLLCSFANAHMTGLRLHGIQQAFAGPFEWLQMIGACALLGLASSLLI